MTNFAFLKNFNNELYEIGVELEKDVLNSPRAVPADATLFLETLVKDIYRLSGNENKYAVISFYKKISHLHRAGVISYIYKNKLQEAYNLRNVIHGNRNTDMNETEIALDLHRRLYYIAKKYFQDFSDEDERYINIPDYKIPTENEIHFNNCIICGCKNNSNSSNMCVECNTKIENGNYIISLNNYLEDESQFSKNDLIEYGLSESQAISLVLNLTKEHLITKKDDSYIFNEENVINYLDEVNNYVNIAIFVDEFFNEEITFQDITKTLEYQNGENGIEPYVEFYSIVNEKITSDFEKEIIKSKNVQKAFDKIYFSEKILYDWFLKEKENFIEGNLNDSFILFNELLIDEYFKNRKKGLGEDIIRQKLHITDDIYDFWTGQFSPKDFNRKLTEIKQHLILNALDKEKPLSKVLDSANLSEREFNEIYQDSKEKNDDFYRKFNRDYLHKRQNLLLRNLNKHNLTKALKRLKISEDEFIKWYFEGENESSQFYLKSTAILMEKYLNARKTGGNKDEILEKTGIPKRIFNSWNRHDDMELFQNFRKENQNITSTLLKRGLIINALKDDKSMDDALKFAGLSEDEFKKIYLESKTEKNGFYRRFDRELLENRQRIFIKNLKSNDFYNAIEKSGVSKKEFKTWYTKSKKEYLSNRNTTDFYPKTTELLMEKYLKARKEGMNKPDSAKCIGLSNNDVNYWIRHNEVDLFANFKSQIDKFEFERIKDGFVNLKSKREISEVNDISIKTIESILILGENGVGKYSELYELFINRVIPAQLNKFLDDIQNKPMKKALKLSDLTERELNHYYRMGCVGGNEFHEFFKKFLKFKIQRYVDLILSKKSHRIALKNSYLSKDEYDEFKFSIDEHVFQRRIDLLNNALSDYVNKTSRLSSISDLSIEKLYELYFRGKRGEVRLEEFAKNFEMIIIIPRVMAYKRAIAIGASKNKLLKALKKDIGVKDFEIWQKNGFIDDFEFINREHVNAEILEKEVMDLFSNSEFLKALREFNDSDSVDFVKKVFKKNGEVITAKIVGVNVKN